MESLAWAVPCSRQNADIDGMKRNKTCDSGPHARLARCLGRRSCSARVREELMKNFNRRQILAIGTGVGTALFWDGLRPAFADNGAIAAIKAFTGGKTPADGRVKLDLPE